MSIDAIVIEPGTPGELRSIDQDLSSMQPIVGGYIEAVYDGTGSIAFFCDEEGKIHGLPVNVVATELWWMTNDAAQGADRLCGTVFITGRRSAHECSVPAAMIALWRAST